MSGSTARAFAPVVLRLGLAMLYLWFGFSEVVDAASWLSWVPQWATDLSHLDAHTIVLLNGSFEVVAGALLAIGIAVRWMALLLALHMLLIVVDIGLTAIGMRDLALSISTLALSLGGSDWLSFDRKIQG